MLGFRIRNIVASTTGDRVLVGAFARTVAIHDLVRGVTSDPFETTFDAGGDRLALSDPLEGIIAGAYNEHGLALYSVATRASLWRTPMAHVQSITLSSDGRIAYCGVEEGPLTVIDVASGRVLRKINGAKAVHESDIDRVALVDSAQPHLVDASGRRLCGFGRTTFAILDVAFGPQLLCISESTGPVRCLRVGDGSEAWRYDPGRGRHVLTLGYDRERDCFLGVEWPYQNGGPKSLKRWSASSGGVEAEHQIGEPMTECFALSGRLLVLADGRILDTRSGEQTGAIA